MISQSLLSKSIFPGFGVFREWETNIGEAREGVDMFCVCILPGGVAKSAKPVPFSMFCLFEFLSPFV